MATPKTSSTSSRRRVRVAGKNPGVKRALTNSPAAAEREIKGLRRGRERLESEPTQDDTDVRASLI